MSKNDTTMRIKKSLLAKLKKASEKEYRTPQGHLEYLLNLEASVNAIEIKSETDFVEMMNSLMRNAEKGVTTEEDKALTKKIFESGAPVYGEDQKGVWGQHNSQYR